MEKYPLIFEFRSRCYGTSLWVSPDLFGQAIKNNDWDRNGPRGIHHYLISGDYPDWLEFPVIFHKNPGGPGKKLRDVMDMAYPPCYLISERLKGLLTSNGVTGWKTYPVLVYDNKENEIPGYYGFSVTGRGGKVKYTNDDILHRTPKEVLYDIRQWDGNEFFTLHNGGSIWMTERVYRLLKKEKITALEDLPSEKLMTVIDYD